jgi:hypothetical protein
MIKTSCAENKAKDPKRRVGNDICFDTLLKKAITQPVDNGES